MKNVTKKAKTEAQKQRNREKAKLKYQSLSQEERTKKIEKQIEWNQENRDKCRQYESKYATKNPEKREALMKAWSIKCPDGMVHHHWSYLEEHQLDVLFLTPSQHQYIHRYLIYDRVLKCYKTVSGLLLDSKEKHDYYITIITDFAPYVHDMIGFLKMFGY